MKFGHWRASTELQRPNLPKSGSEQPNFGLSICQDSSLGGQIVRLIDLQGMHQGATNSRLAELFSSHYNEVLAFCARRVGRGEAEDAAADVFAIAVRRAEEIDWTTVRPWLYGIARGVLANRWRTLQRRQRLLMRMATFSQTTSEPPADVVVRRADDHEALVALQRLRANDREILMLAAWEEMSGPEIAQTLGITVSAAEQRLHRAKKRYARVLDPQLTASSLTSEGTET